MNFLFISDFIEFILLDKVSNVNYWDYCVRFKLSPFQANLPSFLNHQNQYFWVWKDNIGWYYQQRTRIREQEFQVQCTQRYLYFTDPQMTVVYSILINYLTFLLERKFKNL